MQHLIPPLKIPGHVYSDGFDGKLLCFEHVIGFVEPDDIWTYRYYIDNIAKTGKRIKSVRDALECLLKFIPNRPLTESEMLLSYKNIVHYYERYTFENPLFHRYESSLYDYLTVEVHNNTIQ
jgi:hypothetical protein